MPPLAAIDGKLETAWGIRFGEARNPFLALRFADAVHTTADTTIVVTLRHESALRRAVIGRFRLALAADAFAWPPTADAGRRLRSRDPSGRTTWASGLPEDVMRALRRPPEDRDDVEATAVREYLIFSNPALPSAIERCSCWRPSAVCSTRRFLAWSRRFRPSRRKRASCRAATGWTSRPRSSSRRFRDSSARSTRRASARRGSISRTGWCRATIRSPRARSSTARGASSSGPGCRR